MIHLVHYSSEKAVLKEQKKFPLLQQRLKIFKCTNVTLGLAYLNIIFMTPMSYRVCIFPMKKVIVNIKVNNKTQLYFNVLPNEAKLNKNLIGHPNLRCMASAF